MAQISSQRQKQKKTKTDKIFELEVGLKLCREENTLLRQELDGGSVPSMEKPGKKEYKKMQCAFQAMKHLLISQEETIHSLRKEVMQGRKRAREQDRLLETVQKQLGDCEISENARSNSSLGHNHALLGQQIEKLEKAFLRERGRTTKLQKELNEKKKAIEALQARLGKRIQRRMSEQGMISRKASGSSNDSRPSRDLSALRRTSSERRMTDVKSLASKRTETTVTTSSSFPSKSSSSERSLDDAIHGNRSDVPAERGRVLRQSSSQSHERRRKKTKSPAGPARTRSCSKADKRRNGGKTEPKKSDEKRRGVTRKKSDLSMIRMTSLCCQGSVDGDGRSVVSRRTAKSGTSRSKNSGGSAGGLTLDSYQATRHGHHDDKKRLHESFESHTSSWDEFEDHHGNDDNHSIKEVAWNPQGSCNNEQIFEDTDISDGNFW